MTISQRIFDTLPKKHLTQADLSKATGISSGTISDWKTKGTNPSSDKIAIISEFLGVSAYWLLTGNENAVNKSLIESVVNKSLIESVVKKTLAENMANKPSIGGVVKKSFAENAVNESLKENVISEGFNISNSLLTADEKELLKNYNELDRRGQHRVHTIIYEELDRITDEKNTERSVR